ncbi:hypothetical protein IAT38_005489 [Cryptococcus sp. DSM 104549]
MSRPYYTITRSIFDPTHHLTSTNFPSYRRLLLPYLQSHNLLSHLLPGAPEPFRKPHGALVHLFEAISFHPLGETAGLSPPTPLVTCSGLPLTPAERDLWEAWAERERAVREVFERSFTAGMWQRLGRLWSVAEIWDELEAEYMPSPTERHAQIYAHLKSRRLVERASQADMLRHWEWYNALIQEGREAGMVLPDGEVTEAWLGTLGGGLLARLVRENWEGMDEWDGKKSWRGMKAMVKGRLAVLHENAPETVASMSAAAVALSGGAGAEEVYTSSGRKVLGEKSVNVGGKGKGRMKEGTRPTSQGLRMLSDGRVVRV